MISFNLICEHDHAFEAWFRNNADFDGQKERGLVSCPHCGSGNVEKALMAPAVSTGKRREQIALAMGEQQKKALAQLKELSNKIDGYNAKTIEVVESTAEQIEES